MHKISGRIAMSVLVGMAMATLFSPSYAAPPPVEAAGKLKLIPKSDLAVRFVYATCVCEGNLKKVGAVLFSGLKVEVANLRDPTVAIRATKGKLKVTFYNLKTSSFQTLTRNIPLLGVGEKITINVFPGALLVKESTKIKAEVQAINSTDFNLSNNVKTAGYNICHPPIQ